VRVARICTCHPNRKHRAHGLCNTCYHREKFRNNPIAREKRRQCCEIQKQRDPERFKKYREKLGIRKKKNVLD